MAVGDMSPDDWPAVEAAYTQGIATSNATFETNSPGWEAWEERHLSRPRLVVRVGEEVMALPH